jgi:N6-L-threonylcarbamoyladenine synthase
VSAQPASYPLILGIETSCDETAAAVVRGAREVLSNVVASQHDLHAEFAGVVPEIASRAHLERILPVIKTALREADVELSGLDAIAVGHRPGLIGSLLVGVSAAKALAWSLGKPLIGVDHILAHLFACELSEPLAAGSAGALVEESRVAQIHPRAEPGANGHGPPIPIIFPAIGLVVSGGHTSLFLVRGVLDIELIGRTIDDAAGEAFDKAATILELGYPGGPAIDRLAREGNDRAHDFPGVFLGPESLDFSFSGLKTALLYAVRGVPHGRGGDASFARDASMLSHQEKADFAASFQRAVVRAIMKRIDRALDQNPEIRCLVVGGGVSANTRLRADLCALASKRGLDFRLPHPAYCIDNAAMIAGYAARRFERGHFDDLALTAATSSTVSAASA